MYIDVTIVSVCWVVVTRAGITGDWCQGWGCIVSAGRGSQQPGPARGGTGSRVTGQKGWGLEPRYSNTTPAALHCYHCTQYTAQHIYTCRAPHLVSSVSVDPTILELVIGKEGSRNLVSRLSIVLSLTSAPRKQVCMSSWNIYYFVSLHGPWDHVGF